MMFMEERQTDIVRRVNETGRIMVSEIQKIYNVSADCARRDLRCLESKGLLQRTHGGAILPQQVSVRPPIDRKFESMPIFPNYREIAKCATQQISKNDIVYLTGGSFGHIMVQFLPKDFHYTVVVNSVDVAKELRDFENIDVYIAGGKMRRSGSVTDSLAAEFVSRLHFDVCFITGGGLSAEFGLSNGTDETATFQRAVLRNSRKKYLLISSAKVGANSFIKVCDADIFDAVLTDWDCVEDQISALEDKGVQVIVVDETYE